MDKKALVTISVVLSVFLILGQAVVYWANPYSFDSDISVTDDSLEYDLSSSAYVDYSMIVFDNGIDLNGLYLYYDESYAVVGSRDSQKNFIDEITIELKRRNAPGLTIVDANELKDIMSADPSGIGVIMTSGAFPSTVYNATEQLALDWVKNGGTLYWMGYAIDSCYAESTGIQKLPDVGSRFFGPDTVNTSGGYGFDHSPDRDIGEMFSMHSNGLMGGLATGLADTLYLGYQNDDFASISITSVGSGAVAVFGGDLNGAVRISAAQTISSGLSYSVDAEDIVHMTGSFKGSRTGSLDVSGMVSITAYVYYGMDHLIYGKKYVF